MVVFGYQLTMDQPGLRKQHLLLEIGYQYQYQQQDKTKLLLFKMVKFMYHLIMV